MAFDQCATSSAPPVGLAPVVKPRHYRQTAEHHLGLHLDEKFAPLQQRCSILAAAGENTKERVMAILDEVRGLSELPTHSMLVQCLVCSVLLIPV